MSNSDTKLKFLGWMKTAAAANTDINYADAAAQLEVSTATLKRWETEFKEVAKTQVLLDVLDADELIIDKAIELIEEEVALDIDENGVISTVVPEQVKHLPESKSIIAFKDKLTGLDMLKSEVQGTAGIAVTSILKALNDPDTSPAEIARLTKALTDIQMAFFNKQQTNIQIANVTTDSTSMLNSFQNKLRN